MSAILRISGKNLALSKLLSDSALLPDSTWERGQPRFDNEVNDTSGARYVLSDADMSDLAKQIDESILRLKQDIDNYHYLANFDGVEWAVLDYGAEISPPGWSSFTFPPELNALLGEAGISLALSVYPVDKDAE